MGTSFLSLKFKDELILKVDADRETETNKCFTLQNSCVPSLGRKKHQELSNHESHTVVSWRLNSKYKYISKATMHMLYMHQLSELSACLDLQPYGMRKTYAFVVKYYHVITEQTNINVKITIYYCKYLDTKNHISPVKHKNIKT